MKILVKANISGPVVAQKGQVVETTKEQGEKLIGLGWAEEVKAKPKPKGKTDKAAKSKKGK